MGMPSSAVKREPKPEATNPAPAMSARVAPEKVTPEYNHFEVASSTSVANWTPPAPEPPLAKPSVEAPQETFPTPSSSPAETRDFMSKGLMAYEQPNASTGASVGKTPLILGAAALVLAGVCGVVFFVHRGSAPSPVAKAAVSQPATPQSAPASNAARPAPVQAARETAVPAPAQTETQLQAQPMAAAPAQSAAAVSPIPAAEVASASATEAMTDSRTTRRQDKSAAAAKQPDAPAPKRPMISNLKIAAPSAPNRKPDDLGDTSAPITEIASAEMPAGTTSAGILTSSGRTANPPAPPSALEPPPPAKVITDPKLISSTRPVYPVTARQSNIEGSVTVVIYIDKTGKVFSARALSGPVMLRAAAEDAVKQWKYSPGLEDGNPAQSHVVVKVDFKIN
jgi:protein TonB